MPSVVNHKVKWIRFADDPIEVTSGATTKKVLLATHDEADLSGFPEIGVYFPTDAGIDFHRIVDAFVGGTTIDYTYTSPGTGRKPSIDFERDIDYDIDFGGSHVNGTVPGYGSPPTHFQMDSLDRAKRKRSHKNRK